MNRAKRYKRPPGPPRKPARPDSELTRRMRAKGYYLCSEAAERVGVHKATVYRWIRENVVEAVDFNGAYYIHWNSVIQHMGQVAGILGLKEEQGVNATSSDN